MKKPFAVVAIFVAVCSVCFAAAGQYSFGDGRFYADLLPSDELYPEALFDIYSPQSDLTPMFLSGGASNPIDLRTIVQDSAGMNQYMDLPYRDDDLGSDDNMYLRMKTGINLSLFRIGFGLHDALSKPLVEIEGSVQGTVSTLFCGFEKNDTLGFDGTYFFGANVRIADIVSLRFGLHHFSGHYGDEMLEKFYAKNGIDFSSSDPELTINGTAYKYIGLMEYVRDNSYLMGVSVQTPWFVRIYGELEIPKNPSWIRPFAHTPADYENTIPGDEGRPTLIDRIGGDAADGEHWKQSQLDAEQELKRSGNYKALRIMTGVEVTVPIPSFGSVFAGVNIQLHQDGQTKHQYGQYSADNPWEFEITAGGGIEIGSGLRIEAFYHEGRVPALNWFYSRTKMVGVGFSIDG